MTAALRCAALCIALGWWSSVYPACTTHACSNDSLPVPIVGDERMTWGQVWEERECSDANEPCIVGPVRCYRVGRWADSATWNLCEQSEVRVKANGGLAWRYVLPPTEFMPYRVNGPAFPVLGQQYEYWVQSCEGVECSALAGPVEFVGMPYQCWPGGGVNVPGSAGCQ